MKTKQVTVAVIQDNRRAKKDDKGNEVYPIKLRITYAGERLYYPLHEDCSLRIWDEVLKSKGGGEHIKYLRSLKAKEEGRAAKIIDRLRVDEKPFTLALFDSLFTVEVGTPEQRADLNDIFASIFAYAEKLKADGRISTAESYESLLSSLQRFHKRKTLAVVELTADYLKRYQKFMEMSGRKDGKGGQRLAGIGIYMRNLRCIVNQALNAGLIDKDAYPFGKGKYEIPTGGSVKKALTIDQIRAIREYPLPENSTVQRARDLWVFSYLCNGMNLKDICLLRWSDVDGDVMHFVRAKTKHTTKETIHIRVILTDLTKEIIARWGNPDRRPDAYVFPFLRPDMTPQQVRYATLGVIKSVNKHVQQIALELNITAPVTTYSARHSFASVMIRGNVPAKFIGDMMGHAGPLMMQKYINEANEDEQRDYVKSLL